MNTDRDIMQQALEAMGTVGADWICEASHHAKKDQHKLGEPCPLQQRWHTAYQALRERLAQPDGKQLNAYKLLVKSLEEQLSYHRSQDEKYREAIATLQSERQANAVLTEEVERLAQPEQEPVAWGVFDGPNLHDVNFTEEDAQEMVRLKGDGSVVKPLYTSTQPQMQPCAGRNCGSTNPNLHSAECFEDYEKATGMRAWQGLTDEEKAELDAEHGDDTLAHLDAIEAKLREKNA